MKDKQTYSIYIDDMQTSESYDTIEDARDAAEWIWGKGEDGEIYIVDDLTGDIVDEFI